MMLLMNVDYVLNMYHHEYQFFFIIHPVNAQNGLRRFND